MMGEVRMKLDEFITTIIIYILIYAFILLINIAIAILGPP